jgi:hypothetical protein
MCGITGVHPDTFYLQKILAMKRVTKLYELNAVIFIYDEVSFQSTTGD